MAISPNAYYNYLKDSKAQYRKTKEKVKKEISHIYHDLNGIVGYRKMKVFLERRNIYLSNATIHKYMNKELKLRSITRRKKPQYKKGKAHKIFPNLLKQNFVCDKPNMIWCTDFTYLKLSNGLTRYNCSIIDLYDRSVVASLNGKSITADLAIRTLKKALIASGCNPSKLTIHSDQGSQFTSLDYISFCLLNGITQSMSRAGTPYDNAVMERFYNTLKEELIYQFSFDSDEELNKAVYEYTYFYYNQIRPHSYNGHLTPFEKRFSKIKMEQGVTKKVD